MTTTTETIPARVDSRFRGGMSAAATIVIRGLRRRLEQTVASEVRFDAGAKALYATDASNYRQVPLGVVIPKTLEDIVATHRACHEFGAPVLPRGGGTSLSGETVNFAIVIDVSKYLTEIGDADAQT
jgi:FAD/FMN-containing dehydrogenase